MSTLQINKTKYKQFKIAAIGSGGVLVLGGLAFLQPFSLADNSYASTSSAQVSVTLNPTISVWTTDTNDNTISTVDINTIPDEAIYTGAVRAHVSTNNATGYTLTIQSNSNDAKMVHEDNNITKTIDPITGNGISASNWRNNSDLNNMWGYSISNNDSFKAVPGSSSSVTVIDSTDSPRNDSYTDITFATKADLSLTSGTYTDTVVFSAVANIVPNNYMQNFTASDCAKLNTWTTENNNEITLYDKRNNESYIIRKLSDGNCWMMENLYLPHTYQTEMNSETTNLPEGATVTLPNASSSKFTDSDGMKEMNDGDKSTGSYYNWCVATGETGGCRGTDKAATGDICPKNWRLPTGSGEQNTAASASEQAWLVALGKSTFDTSFYASSPVYPGGYNGSGLYYSGTVAYWWSSTQLSTTGAYGLYANSSGLATGDGYDKHSGRSVRCLLSSE